MFGKGLESLIPPQDSDNNDSYSSPTAPQGDTADEPLEAYLKENTAPIEIPHTEEATISEPQGEPTPDSSFVPVPGTGDEKIEGAIFQIEIESIRPNPHQPRKDFNELALRELAGSIREFGVLQPLIVSKVEGESPSGWSVYYELVAGERRRKFSGPLPVNL